MKNIALAALLAVSATTVQAGGLADAIVEVPAPVVIVPFGAGAKEHGPHLPMNADAVVMDYLVRQAVETRDVIAAPPVLYGWFPAFRDFPGTEIRDPDVFERYVREAALSLVRSGAQRLLFLNTGIDKATGLPISIATVMVLAVTLGIVTDDSVHVAHAWRQGLPLPGGFTSGARALIVACDWHRLAPPAPPGRPCR